MSERNIGEKILELAARPDGFGTGELSGHSIASVYARCRELLDQGKLFRAAVGTRNMRYFTTAKAASDYDRQRVVSVGMKNMGARASWAKDAKVVINSDTKVTICPTPAPRFQTVTLQFVRTAIQSGRVTGAA